MTDIRIICITCNHVHIIVHVEDCERVELMMHLAAGWSVCAAIEQTQGTRRLGVGASISMHYCSNRPAFVEKISTQFSGRRSIAYKELPGERQGWAIKEDLSAYNAD